MRGEDQPVPPDEQGPVLGGDAVDVRLYRFVHPSIMASPARPERLGALAGLVQARSDRIRNAAAISMTP